MVPSTRKSGFSLIELVTVVAVVGILAAVAIPSFRDIVNNQRIKNASFELFSSLMMARSEAVKRNSNVTITAATGGWEEGWQITAADNTVLKTHSELNNIIVSGAPTSLIFRRTGRLTATTKPSFQFDVDPENEDFVRCISIELSGLPKTSKGECS